MLAERLGREVASACVAEAEHHFARVVELVDSADAEALAKRNPDIRAQAVAIDVMDAMRLVQGGGGPGEKITEDLTYVNEVGRL